MKVNVYSAVLTAGTPSEVRAYLYGHTRQLKCASQGRHTYVVLVTTAEADTELRARDDAQRLAQGQCDRLGSGLHGARVCDSLAAATAHLQAFTDRPLHWHTSPAKVW